MPNYYTKRRTPRTALMAARRYIENPDHWTQRRYAADKDGHSTYTSSLDAVRFCSAGVLMVMSADFVYPTTIDLLAQAAQETAGTDSIVQVNDHMGHEAVVRMFRRAEELAAES